MVQSILVTANIPWPIIGTLLLWALCGLVYFSDRRALIVLIRKCTSGKFNNAELISNFKIFFKFHPLSLHKTDLIIKMIPALIAEGHSVMKWIRKVNGKDVNTQFSEALLFAYFVLSEKSYTDELNLLKKKTDTCFVNDKKFNKVKNCIFNIERIHGDEIEALIGKYSKGIAYYYASCEAYNLGDMEVGNKYANKAKLLVPEKIMFDLVNERISKYEETN